MSQTEAPAVRPGDVVTVRCEEVRFRVEPFPEADQFCVPVVLIADETGVWRRLVEPRDIRPAEEGR